MFTRNRYDVLDLISDLIAGDPQALIILAVIVFIIAFFATYQKITGKSLVKSKSERRAARNRRKIVLYERKYDK